MPKSFLYLWLLLGLTFIPYTSTALAESPSTSKVSWNGWSDDIFQQAQRDNKFALLDLEAIWCHWCHVMNENTYQDPKVLALLEQKFISIKVDQDSNPGLSSRYQNYGWPATIIFDKSGAELKKLSGYIPPEEMVTILTEIVSGKIQPKSKNQETYTQNFYLPEEIKAEFIKRHYQTHDQKLGGFKSAKKYLDGEAVEYSIRLAAAGDKKDEQMARLTLDNGTKLIDPAWGGAYQYSTRADWEHPHFEKVTHTQARYIYLYSNAYALWGDQKYLKAAKDVYKYLINFLQNPEGAFYTSQDADLVKGKHSAEYFTLSDQARRKLGIPAVDQHIYTKQNGLIIATIVTLYDATNNKEYLDSAITAAAYIIKHYALKAGGFKHGEKDQGGPYLSDSLQMCRAFTNLYSATATRE